jgi:hypothetical protein
MIDTLKENLCQMPDTAESAVLPATALVSGLLGVVSYTFYYMVG